MQGLHRMLIEHHFMMVFGGTFAEVVRCRDLIIN